MRLVRHEKATRMYNFITISTTGPTLMTIHVRSRAANKNIKQQPSTPRAVILGGLINRGFGYFAGYFLIWRWGYDKWGEVDIHGEKR